MGQPCAWIGDLSVNQRVFQISLGGLSIPYILATMRVGYLFWEFRSDGVKVGRRLETAHTPSTRLMKSSAEATL